MAVGVILVLLLGLASPALAQQLPVPQPAPSQEEVARSRQLELNIADRTIQQQAQAFQAVERQLRQELAAEWAKALQRAEAAEKEVADLRKQLDDLRKQPAPPKP